MSEAENDSACRDCADGDGVHCFNHPERLCNPIPKMRHLHSLDKRHYQITGWEDVHRWAMLNDVHYRALNIECDNAGLQQEDRYRTIIQMLLMLKHKQFEQDLEKAMNESPKGPS